MRCPTADTLRQAWYDADTIEALRVRGAALIEHLRQCPVCREIARRDTEQAEGATMPAMEEQS